MTDHALSPAMQAKDIPDADALRAVFEAGGTGEFKWAMFWDVAERFPDAPGKVVRAKLAALIRRKLAHGCTCGCRGDFWVTDAGKALLGGR